MKKDSFIYKNKKVLYKILLKKEYGTRYKVILKFKYKGELFYKKTSLSSFYNNEEIDLLLYQLNELTEDELAYEISKSISYYYEDINKKEKMKQIKKNWM